MIKQFEKFQNKLKNRKCNIEIINIADCVAKVNIVITDKNILSKKSYIIKDNKDIYDIQYCIKNYDSSFPAWCKQQILDELSFLEVKFNCFAKLNKEKVINIAKSFGVPRHISQYDKDIYTIDDLKNFLSENMIDIIETTGVWGKNMIWIMGRKHEWNNSAGIVTVIW